MNERTQLIKDFVKALSENNAAIFAGAGLSVASGFVDWKSLMREIAADVGLDVDKESDLIAVAQYHVNDRLGNRHKINQTMIEHFTEQVQLTQNHKILANLPISTFWTTNYDSLIEKSLENANKTADVKRVSENLLLTMPKRDAVVYKMHGDIFNPSEAVLTKDDYEVYEIKRKAYSITLQSDLMSKRFLFLGFSFEDPNLMYILMRIKNLIGTRDVKTHYAIFKKETDLDKAHKQKLRLKDLFRYGIHAVLIDDYSDITEILNQIKKLNNRSNVFISGAAYDFGEWENDNRGKTLIHELSKKLASKGIKIISGYGFNVGSGVINGALDYMFSTNYRNLDEYLSLMPFPQYLTGSRDKSERNKKYREMMLANAGFAVFLFGNKIKDGEMINSTGMYEEFEIAVSKGIIPIPIGATGYTALRIWKEVNDNYDSYYQNVDVKVALETLGDKKSSCQQLVDATYEIIKKLTSVESVL